MISFQLYDRDGTTLLGLLAEPTSWQMSVEFSDVGALQFEYPLNGANASQIAELREIAVVNTSTTAEIKNARYVITGIDRERAEVNGTIRVSCRSILWRFETALAYPDGGVGSGSKRTFTTANGGTILKTLIDAAQTRGALSGITYTFTNTTDSNSLSWLGSLSQEFAARTSILSVMRSLNDLGLAEVETLGRQLRACNTEGIGTDRTTGATPVVLRYGQNLTEAPERLSAERLAAVALVEGDDDLTVERTNATSLSTYGRLETSLTASGATSTAQVESLGDAYLTNLASPDRQLTVGLIVNTDLPRPLIDFNVGDYVYTATSAGLERVRVRQLTLSMDAGALSATAVLGDRIFEAEIRFARRLAALTSSAANAGELPTQAPDPATADTLAPSAPTGLTGTTTAYVQANEPRSQVALTWTAPTTNTDSSALTDLRAYRVDMRTGAGEAWQFVALVDSNSATIRNLLPGVGYRFQVKAIDASSNLSAASNEFTITTTGNTSNPTAPSTPTVVSRLGTLSISWNGLSSTGGAMPSDFAYIEVHVSTTNGFTPSSTSLKGRMTGADFIVLSDLTYSTTYYVRFVSYNKSGTASSASAQASASIQPLVNTDIIDATLSGAKFAGGTINTAQLADGSVQASKILNGAVVFGKIAADAVGANEIAANAIVAGKIAANAVTAGTVAALAISAGNIQSNAITADKIDAGAITAVKIAASTITGDKIAAGTITASNIAAGTITADRIAAGTITTDKLVAGTLSGFTFQSVNAAFQITSVGNIIGANSINCGSLTAVQTVSGATVSATGTVSGSGISSTGNIEATLDITANRDLYTPNHTTVTDAANGRVTLTLGRVTRSTASSQRYKENITPLRDIDELDPKRLLQIPVRAFTYREDYLSESDSRFGALIPGFIAEEVDAVYPVAADYENGNVESWNDRMMIPGLLALIQDLYARIETLEGNL